MPESLARSWRRTPKPPNGGGIGDDCRALVARRFNGRGVVAYRGGGRLLSRTARALRATACCTAPRRVFASGVGERKRASRTRRRKGMLGLSRRRRRPLLGGLKARLPKYSHSQVKPDSAVLFHAQTQPSLGVPRYLGDRAQDAAHCLSVSFSTFRCQAAESSSSIAVTRPRKDNVSSWSLPRRVALRRHLRSTLLLRSAVV